jgi:hypothetical protein
MYVWLILLFCLCALDMSSLAGSSQVSIGSGSGSNVSCDTSLEFSLAGAHNAGMKSSSHSNCAVLSFLFAICNKKNVLVGIQ